MFVVGDFGFTPVHSAIAPNAALAEARLLTKQGAAVTGWEAIARSNGGSAFVYARGERAAIRARDVLQTEAEAARVFRVLSADEMLRAGADPEAWFGLEAEPGYVFEDAASGPRDARRSAARCRRLRFGRAQPSSPASPPGVAGSGGGSGFHRCARRTSRRRWAACSECRSTSRDGRVLVGIFEAGAVAGVAAEGR